MTRDLALRDPESRLDLLENWTDMTPDARKRRAAEASQIGDREELQSLLRAHVLAFGRRGTDTSARTLETYWRGSRNLLDWCDRKAVKAHQLQEGHARRWLASMGTLSPKTRRTYLTGARALLDALRWAGMGAEDPLANVRITDPTPVEEKADPYTVEELNALLAEADDRERVLVLLAADAGLRLAEAVGLTWGRISFETSEITVQGKGGKQATITATRRLLAALEKLRGDRERGRVVDISRRRVQQIINRLCERSGVEVKGYHALRHSCGTRLYGMTKDLKVVQRHLRHSSARTSELYAHLAKDAYSEAVAALDGNGVEGGGERLSN